MFSAYNSNSLTLLWFFCFTSKVELLCQTEASRIAPSSTFCSLNWVQRLAAGMYANICRLSVTKSRLSDAGYATRAWFWILPGLVPASWVCFSATRPTRSAYFYSNHWTFSRSNRHKSSKTVSFNPSPPYRNTSFWMQAMEWQALPLAASKRKNLRNRPDSTSKW